MSDRVLGFQGSLILVYRHAVKVGIKSVAMRMDFIDKLHAFVLCTHDLCSLSRCCWLVWMLRRRGCCDGVDVATACRLRRRGGCDDSFSFCGAVTQPYGRRWTPRWCRDALPMQRCRARGRVSRVAVWRRCSWPTCRSRSTVRWFPVI